VREKYKKAMFCGNNNKKKRTAGHEMSGSSFIMPNIASRTSILSKDMGL